MTDHANTTSLPCFPSVPEIGLTDISGEPRARDIDLAERLGFERPRKIREIIERNLAEIETLGSSPRRGAMIQVGKGAERAVEEYWLNEEQALLVSVLSKAQNAPVVRAMLIKTFVAWRRGHLVEAPAFDMQAAMEHLARTMLPGMIETAIAADPRRAVMNYVSVRQLLEDAKALQKGRRGINRKMGWDLKIRALLERPLVPVMKCPHSGVWLYPRAFAANYMLAQGNQLVKDHNAKVLGQGVLKLVPKKPGPAEFAPPPL